MRPLTFSLALLMLLALPGLAVADDAQNAKLEELWKTGSLWQVGDNIPKVEAARKEIVAAGDAGLAFIFTKLSSTDGLEYRCLEAVFKGFGAKALPGLLERMGHEDVKVRRNVAAMFGVIDDKSAAAKMVEHLKKESDLRCKVGHLQTLARWKEPTALDPLIECTRVTQEQEPLAERLKVRIVPLLGNYEDEKAIARLIELLDDPAFFVRDAARDALKSSPTGRAECRKAAFALLSRSAEIGKPGRLCRILSVIGNESGDVNPRLLLRQPEPTLRAAAINAGLAVFESWFAELQRGETRSGKQSAWRDECEGKKEFWKTELSDETDPFVLQTYERAVDRLNVLENQLSDED
jgi:hypothetical protein